ncbi:MAG: putative ATP-dependent RNA helicase [Candidatus Methanocomedens sp.]|nr:MAG: putative ATP-dependent RNA helicase [ANME-2 cluster archaeon]
MESFKKLGITKPILKSIIEQRFESPTEIQEKAIPLILAGNDVIAGSSTGSGKTLAFASGILQNSIKGKGIQALILTPTRELAEQVANSFRQFSKHRPLEVVAVYGGMGINPQIKALKTADVVVGTPGRMLDHLARKTIKLGKVETLVLDEADRMFDMGFKQDVEKIIKQCPPDRQTLLFSATISRDIVKLSRNSMKKPLQVSVDPYVDVGSLDQTYYQVQDDMKLSLLVHLLKHEKSDLVMVFCNTKRNTDKVAKNLRVSNIDAQAIHGGLTQGKRTTVMKRFSTGKSCVLVCTDVAARGLDIEGISHVYNYDVPRESNQYIHRIGRTARAGAYGKAISIISRSDQGNFSSILRENNVDIKKVKVPSFEKIVVRKPHRNMNNTISRKGQQPNRHKNR